MVNPEEVLSPKSRLSGEIEVLVRGEVRGEDGKSAPYSIASFTWDNAPVTGIRWDGTPGTKDSGNPQSRGIATWFVLPDPVAAVILKHLRTEGSMPTVHSAGQLSLDELDERMEQIAERVATRLLEQHS